MSSAANHLGLERVEPLGERAAVLTARERRDERRADNERAHPRGGHESTSHGLPLRLILAESA